MRAFVDRDGARWGVVLGRESWGTLLLLFVPAAGGLPVRQAFFPAVSYDIAVVELDRLTDERLQQLLDAAEPRPD